MTNFDISFQVKIWFQNRRSKYKKMMKAAQQQVSTPGGNSNNGGSGGPGHGMLGSGQPHTPGALPGGNSPQPPAGILGGESRIIYSTSNCAENKE